MVDGLMCNRKEKQQPIINQSSSSSTMIGCDLMMSCVDPHFILCVCDGFWWLRKERLS
jgi:hypothetical protein